MDAGIDHQPARAPHFVTQATEVLIRAAVYAHLDAEFFGIQAPAFAKGADVQIAPKIGHVFQFLRQRPLVMMARDRFVQGQRGQLVKRSLIQRISVDPVGAADGTADRWADIGRGRVIRRHFVRHGHDPVGQARQLAKKTGHQVIDALGRIGRFLEQLFCTVRIKLRVGAQEFGKGREVAVKFEPGNQRIHFGTNAGDLGKTDVVNLCRALVGDGGV